MILYHGTSLENKEKILQEGFNTSYGEYGTGVYLAKSKDLAYDYGDEIIEVYVDEEYIHIIDTDNIEENSEVENVAFKNNYSAVCIQYNQLKSDKDHTEICVYDTDIIEIN